jgi:hypothetical protein
MEERVGVVSILRAGRPKILVRFLLRARNLSLLTSDLLLLLLLSLLLCFIVAVIRHKLTYLVIVNINYRFSDFTVAVCILVLYH